MGALASAWGVWTLEGCRGQLVLLPPALSFNAVWSRHSHSDQLPCLGCRLPSYLVQVRFCTWVPLVCCTFMARPSPSCRLSRAHVVSDCHSTLYHRSCYPCRHQCKCRVAGVRKHMSCSPLLFVRPSSPDSFCPTSLDYGGFVFCAIRPLTTCKILARWSRSSSRFPIPRLQQAHELLVNIASPCSHDRRYTVVNQPYIPYT